MKYNQEQGYKRNHVILPGSEKILENFLNASTLIKGEPKQHKLEYSNSSNSEDALTWSCFDALRNYKPENLSEALNEILEDAFDNKKPFDIKLEKNIKIEIGKEYFAPNLGKEKTEVDTSIETDDKLIFIEAKLYSLISLPSDTQTYNQIANKLRIGLDYARSMNKEFYFIFLDIAPMEKLLLRKPKAEADEKGHDYIDKWKSAWWFNYYKNNSSLTPLKTILNDITQDEAEIIQMQKNMGWLTWASLFKTVLRAVIN